MDADPGSRYNQSIRTIRNDRQPHRRDSRTFDRAAAETEEIMKRRVIGMLLAGAMAAGLLAGCGGQEQGGAAVGENQAAAGTTENGGSAGAEGTGEVQTINMYTMGIGSTTDYKAVQDAINEISREKIGVEVNWTVLDIGQWFEQYNLLLSGSEPVDLMVNMGGVSQGVSQGAFLELDDLYAQYGQDIASYYDEEFLKAGVINGNLYGIAGQKDFAATTAITYRKDIVEELNLDVSNVKTLADWTPVMEAVHEAYPDMPVFVSNGGNTLNQFGSYNWDSLEDRLGVLMNYGEGTEVVNLYETEEYEALIRQMREWYQAGLVDKDAATNTESWGDMVRSGKGFFSLVTGNPGSEYEHTLNTGYPIGVIPITEPLSTTGNVTAVMWSIPYAAAEPEAAMKFLNLMYSDPAVSDLLNYGIEGVHYQVAEDGTYTWLDGQDMSSCAYHPAMTWIWPDSYIGGEWQGAAPELGKKMTEFNRNAKKSKAMGFTFDNTSVINEVTACNNVIQQYAYGLEVGAVDVDTVLPEFRQALKDAGIDKVIGEKQRQLDAWLAAQE